MVELVEDLAGVVFVLLSIYRLSAESESFVLVVDGARDEHHLVGQVLHAELLQARDSVEAILSLDTRHVLRLGVLLSRLQELLDVRDDDQLSGKDRLISRLWLVDQLTSQNDVNASGH